MQGLYTFTTFSAKVLYSIMKEKNTHFDANDIGVPNGRFFGMPFDNKECQVVLIPVPWDATVSYSAGTANGPDAVTDASVQVDLFDECIKGSENFKIGTDESTIEVEGQLALVDEYIAYLNTIARADAEKIIARLAGGKPLTKALQSKQASVNEMSMVVNDLVYAVCQKYYLQGKIPGVVGGEHSVAFGAVEAAAAQMGKGEKLGVLQIDAHADLRKAYEGFEFSHASIMRNVLDRIANIGKLVQVGIRDFCSDEATYAAKNKKVVQFTDNAVGERLFCGEKWNAVCKEISAALPSKVYISFDIDGLEPSLCPHTGTPVPGGLTWGQALHLLRVIGKEHTIVGFDLNEVAPAPGGKDEWDANVGARMLYKLSLIASESKKKGASPRKK